MKKLCAVIFMGLLSGCAVEGYQSGTRVVVDWSQIDDNNRYYQDLTQCRALSEEVPGAGQSAAAGAVGGALFGALVGALIGDAGDFALHGAGLGAVSGAAGGAGHGAMNRDLVIKNCLRGRGYNVLN